MPVKGITHLRAQGVTRAEASGLQTVRVTKCKEFVPNRFDVLSRRDDLKAVLARVPSASEINFGSHEIENAKLVFLQSTCLRHASASGTRTRKTGVDEFHHARTLQRYCAELV